MKTRCSPRQRLETKKSRDEKEEKKKKRRTRRGSIIREEPRFIICREPRARCPLRYGARRASSLTLNERERFFLGKYIYLMKIAPEGFGAMRFNFLDAPRERKKETMEIETRAIYIYCIAVRVRKCVFCQGRCGTIARAWVYTLSRATAAVIYKKCRHIIEISKERHMSAGARGDF